jgi:hypothetical protein
MLTGKSLLAGTGAVFILYVAVVLYKESQYFFGQVARGPMVPAPAKIVLMSPVFWLAAVIVFVGAAFWMKK